MWKMQKHNLSYRIWHTSKPMRFQRSFHKKNKFRFPNGSLNNVAKPFLTTLKELISWFLLLTL
jgi:hypothetical protein